MVNSKTLLALFRRNPHEFLFEYIIVDEIWIHYCTSETNAKYRVFEEEKDAKKAKIVKSSGDDHGFLRIIYADSTN